MLKIVIVLMLTVNLLNNEYLNDYFTIGGFY